MKQRFAAFAVLAGLLSLLLVAPAAAAPPPANQVQGAAGLVNALVGLNNSGSQIGLINIGNSLNNLTALNNVLNNSPILSNNNVLNGSPILNNNSNFLNILQGALTHDQFTILNNFLNNNHIAIGQVLGVAVLSGGGIAVIV